MDPGVCRPGTAHPITGTSEHPGYHPDPKHRPAGPAASPDPRALCARGGRSDRRHSVYRGRTKPVAPRPVPADLARYAGGVSGAREDLSEPGGARSARPGQWIRTDRRSSRGGSGATPSQSGSHEVFRCGGGADGASVPGVAFHDLPDSRARSPSPGQAQYG
jgi:hypothetical protein